MTVHELITELQKVSNQNLPVKIEYENEFDDGDGYIETYSVENDIEGVYTSKDMKNNMAVFLNNC